MTSPKILYYFANRKAVNTFFLALNCSCYGKITEQTISMLVQKTQIKIVATYFESVKKFAKFVIQGIRVMTLNFFRQTRISFSFR